MDLYRTIRRAALVAGIASMPYVCDDCSIYNDGKAIASEVKQSQIEKCLDKDDSLATRGTFD